MAKLDQAVKDIHAADNADGENYDVHPLSRLLVTVIYIITVVSFKKYDIAGLAGMILYILIQCIWYEISILGMIKRIWPVFILTGMIGIANPLFDSTASAGALSMATLILKGIFCVSASYIMVVQTGVRQLCYALRILHLPKELVTILLLMHRYLILLLKELERMKFAYRLRAPGQKGLHFKTWGSFAGLLLLRSMDRAGEVYESMQLRGFGGAFKISSYRYSPVKSISFAAAWSIVILGLRIFPVFRMAEVAIWQISNLGM